jgi:hypothetical protein
LEGAVDGRLARLEHRGGVGGAEAEHVAEHEYGSLAGRQALERGDEGEPDRLAARVYGGRPSRPERSDAELSEASLPNQVR